jgi:hypothetical protein
MLEVREVRDLRHELIAEPVFHLTSETRNQVVPASDFPRQCLNITLLPETAVLFATTSWRVLARESSDCRGTQHSKTSPPGINRSPTSMKKTANIEKKVTHAAN